MTQYLPPNLLAFFAPREPLPFLPPVVKLPHEKKTKGYFGVGQYLHLFEDPKDTPPPTKIETREERLERKKREKQEQAAYIKEQGIALLTPTRRSSSPTSPPDTTESKLRKEFEQFGPIQKISIIYDKISGKHKGYAFVEYENEKDMHAAYKYGDGKKIEGRRVLVDVERGRTVKGWLPKRLGGGLSETKKVQSRDDRDDKSFGSRSGGGGRSDRRNGGGDRDRGARRGTTRSRSRSRSPIIVRDHRTDRGDRGGDSRGHKSSRAERGEPRGGGDRGNGERAGGDRSARNGGGSGRSESHRDRYRDNHY
ncbi:U1 small nuclear ribonucleoprotein 70 kDa [Tyrophagus putrescentiae]|nr:U1 small nuclear ribonucleoprotein 70 kDa [Tyrophagus putrescentiae]